MSIYHEMEVGSHVLCIEDGPIQGQDKIDLDGLVAGTVYTVRSIGFIQRKYYEADPDFYNSIDPPIFLRLEEIRNRPDDAEYWAGRFRPLKKLTLKDFRDVSLPVGDIMQEFLEHT